MNFINQSFIKLLVIVFLSLFTSLSSQTNIYYVDNENRNASDANPGTEGEPWKTIQKAASTLIAGETVYIKSGTYTESVSVGHSGTANDYITFSAYPGDEHQVLISETFTIKAKNFIKVTGLRRNLGNMGFRVDGPSTGVILDSNYTYGTRSSGISVWGVPWGVDPGNYDNITNIIIKNNIVEKACDGGWNECITLANGVKGFKLIYNEVKNGGDGTNGGEGIDIKEGCSEGIIAYNYVHHLSRRGIYLDGGRNMDYHGYARPIVENIHIYGNIAHDQRGGGGFAIMTEGAGYVRNIYIYNNLFYRNPSDGIMYYLHPEGAANNGLIYNITAVNNVCYKNGRNGILNNFWTSYNMVIRNNICYDNGSSDLWLQSGESIADHNLVGIDPKFVDAASGDFHLLEGSLAIDSGSVSLAPVFDFDGMARPYGNGVDIGAFEYGSTNPPIIKEHELVVNSGLGSGTYKTGVWVNIQANPSPAGMVFDSWTGDTSFVAGITDSATIVIMPDTNVSVTASYKDAPDEMLPGKGLGTILRELWTGISGTEVSALTSNANYPDNPTSSNELSEFEAPTEIGDNYGTRIIGYLHPPVEGEYTFWIASDGTSELWLSSDSIETNKELLCSVSEWTSPRDWDKSSENNQESKKMLLKGDTKYFIQAIQKEETGPSDNVSVAWQLSGFERELIDGQYLSPWDFAVSVDCAENDIISEYALFQNYPNPFNPTTTIKFSLKQNGMVSLVVFNSLGEKVANLINENMNMGTHSKVWDASKIPSGIYFYQFKTNNVILTNKMLLLK